MINIDPRTIDWKDSLNPLLLQQYHQERRPADFAMLQHPLYVALRYADTYEPYIQIVPEANKSIEARQTYEARFYVSPGAFLYAFSVLSEEPEGFAWNLYDLGNGGALFGEPINYALTQQGTTSGVTTRQVLLQHPRAVNAPGLLSAFLVNKAAVANQVQLALWFMTPEQDLFRTPTPNRFDAQLQAELQIQGSIRRPLFSGGGSSSRLAPGAGVPTSEPWQEMPPGGRPLRYEKVATVAPGSIDFPIVTVVVPTGYNAAITRHRHSYLGPGFDEGSGSIIWRIAVDGLHSPGFDNMTTTAGGASYEGIAGAIIAGSGQTITYTATVDPDATAPEPILAGIQGWFYPA